jgi:hypothetical protein
MADIIIFTLILNSLINAIAFKIYDEKVKTLDKKKAQSLDLLLFIVTIFLTPSFVLIYILLHDYEQFKYESREQ